MSIFLGLPLLLIAALYAFSRMRRKSGRRPGPAEIGRASCRERV